MPKENSPTNIRGEGWQRWIQKI